LDKFFLNMMSLEVEALNGPTNKIILSVRNENMFRKLYLNDARLSPRIEDIIEVPTTAGYTYILQVTPKRRPNPNL
jgi:hypothetical protein